MRSSGYNVQVHSNFGFTLIELLIVIVIIGILAGVLLTVIDPARQQRKAKETVLRATVEKGCLALHSCGSTTTDSNNCDTKPKVGIKTVDGTPTSATYYLTDAATPGDADSSANASATAPVYFRGVLITGTDTCRFQCSYDFSTTPGPTQMIIPTGSTCLIGVQ
jgi:prepilin-type N-terminal cleavage/methylation domain-containing protein